MILVLRYHGIIHGTIRLVRLVMLQIHSVNQLRCEIGRGRDEQRLVTIKVDAINLLIMSHQFVLFVARHGIVQTNRSVIKRYQQLLVQGQPNHVRQSTFVGLTRLFA